MGQSTWAVCGQYIGAEIGYNAFAKIFEGTAVECDHNIYSLDMVIEDAEIGKISKKECNNLLFPFVNDCRMNIDNKEPTPSDMEYFNVEFVGICVNGWPQTYLIATKDIKKGTEISTYYGEIF